MRLLFLDDEIHRHQITTTKHIGDIISPAWTAQEAIELLKEVANGHVEPYDVVSLDHDLVETHYDNPDTVFGTGSGLEVSRFICENPSVAKQVIVHSLNIVGSKRMFDELKSVGVNVVRKPFGFEKRFDILE